MTGPQIQSLAALRAVYATTPTERLDSLHRGLTAAADRLAALRRHRHHLGAEALAQQLDGLHREAQRLAHQLSEQDVGGPADAA